MKFTMREMVSILTILICFLVAFAALAEEEVLTFTLEEAIDYALQHNPDLLTKKEDLKALEAKITQAEAELFPQVKFNATHTRYEKHPYIKFHSTTDFDAKLDYPVYTGGRITSKRTQTQHLYEAGIEGEEGLRQLLAYKVKEAFYGILLAEELKGLNDKQLELAKKKLQMMQLRKESGQSSNDEILRYEAAFRLAQAESARSFDYLELNKNKLKLLLNLDINTKVALKGTLEYKPISEALDSAISQALDLRPELKEVQKRIEADEAALSVAKSSSLPDVSLNVSGYAPQKAALSSGRGEYEKYFSGYLKLSYPLFDGFSTKGKVDEAKANLSASHVSKKKMTDEVKREVSDAYLNLNSAEEVIESKTKKLEEAEDLYKVSSARHKAGLASNIELAEAGVSLAVAQFEYKEAVSGYLIEEAALTKAIGEKGY